MLYDPVKMSEMIREKKKKLLEADPEVVDSSPHMMNAQDVYDNKILGRIESTLDVPEKSNSDEKMMAMSSEEAQTMGETAEQKSRMGRLRQLLSKMSLGW